MGAGVASMTLGSAAESLFSEIKTGGHGEPIRMLYSSTFVVEGVSCRAYIDFLLLFAYSFVMFIISSASS
jgi:hypothetical protein